VHKPENKNVVDCRWVFSIKQDEFGNLIKYKARHLERALLKNMRCWFKVFESVLKDVGFENLRVDRCIYILDKGDISRNIYILLYVDGVVTATNKSGTMSNFKSYLHDKFQMTDLREIRHFIGIKTDRTNGEICFSQTAYIKNILKKCNMEDCKSVSTPCMNVCVREVSLQAFFIAEGTIK